MFKEKFGSHTRKHSIDSLQKIAILETSHIVRRVLQPETGSLSGGGSPLVQEKYEEEMSCDRGNNKNNNNIIIIININIF
jgi:hypothetical protein